MYYIKIPLFLNNNSILIKSDIEEPINLIKEIFFRFGLQNITEKEFFDQTDSFVIEIKKEIVGYKLSGDEEYEELTKQDLVFLLYDLIEKKFSALDLQGYSVLHGAALESNGSTIGLVATTRTGKSTLAAYMSGRGFKCLADDSIIVNRSDYSVCPYFLPISLRNIDLLGDDFQKKILYHGFNRLRNEYNYLFIPQYSKDYIKSTKLKAIVFLMRGHPLKLEKISKSESYLKLLNNIKFSKDFDREIGNMVVLSNKIDCYILYYNELEEARKAIKGILNTTSK